MYTVSLKIHSTFDHNFGKRRQISLILFDFQIDGMNPLSAIILKFWISQGSVATQLGWYGTLYNSYIEKFLVNLSVKRNNFENRSTFADFMIKSQVYCFFGGYCKSLKQLAKWRSYIKGLAHDRAKLYKNRKFLKTAGDYLY